MTSQVVRLDRLERGLGAVVSALLGATATVLWAPSEFPRESAAGLLVALRPIAGPSPIQGGAPSVSAWTLPLGATLTVGAVSPGDVLALEISDWRVEYTVLLADTIETTRDAFLALIEAALVSVEAAAAGTDEITIEAPEVGDLYNLSVSGPLTLVIDTEQTARVQIDEVASVIEVQIYSTDRFMRAGAASAMSRLLGQLELNAARDILDAYGLSVNAGDAIALDDLAGPHWQSRRVSTWTVTQISLAAEAAGVITSAVLEFEARDGASVIATTIEAPEP
jgi:hypothetical protein